MDIQAKDIALRLGETPALAGVDISLRGGEMVGLIGPNGAGKTTLLRVLAGLAKPDAGTLLYGGRRAAELGRREFARRVAFLAQGGQVHWPMRVDHLVALGRLPHRHPITGPDAQDRAAVDRALAAADIGHLRLRSAQTLSGGERMRVLLARALAVEADMLLADEPVAALDPFHQLQIMELMRNTARGGCGVAVVLHDLTLAARFCDRIVLLRKGRVLADGGPDEVLTDEHLSLAFGVQVLRGRHGREAFVLPWRMETADVNDEAGRGEEHGRHRLRL
jgi:iron complex transport system ATP-binding protein